ncbi:MAG: hypothetical protein LBT81_02340 [Helicobacteraceae bacterium]|jgi:hypothetical protein|nr:hypothetical protein [Helicobacteraceae bacterium]
MAITQRITQLPPPPQKGVDYAAQFDSKARTFLNSLPAMGEEENALADQIDETAAEMQTNADSAAASASAANASENAAKTSEDTAAASAAAALVSETNTKTSENNAKTSETQAAKAADILKAAEGGILPAYNFGVGQPSQEDLTHYAAQIIWGLGGNWAWNAADPAASTYIDADSVTHTAGEIFSATRVKNAYYTPNPRYRGAAADADAMDAITAPVTDDFCDRTDTNTEWRYDGSAWDDTFQPAGTTARKTPNEFTNHVWMLTNTPTTMPPIYEWADNGAGDVAIATPEIAGVIRPDDVTLKTDPVTGITKANIFLPLRHIGGAPFQKIKEFLQPVQGLIRLKLFNNIMMISEHGAKTYFSYDGVTKTAEADFSISYASNNFIEFYDSSLRPTLIVSIPADSGQASVLLRTRDLINWERFPVISPSRNIVYADDEKVIGDCQTPPTNNYTGILFYDFSSGMSARYELTARLPYQSIYIPSSGLFLGMTSNNKLQKSTDALAWQDCGGSDIVLDTYSRNTLYDPIRNIVVTTGTKVLRSGDGGESFEAIVLPTGYTGVAYRCQYVPEMQSFIMGGTNGMSISNDGKNWFSYKQNKLPIYYFDYCPALRGWLLIDNTLKNLYFSPA